MSDFVKKKKGLTSNHSTFFLQFTCKDENPDKIEDKKFKLWILAGLHVLTIIIYIVTINCLQHLTMKNKADYEGNVSKIGSYTTEITNLDQLINAYLSQYRDSI